VVFASSRKYNEKNCNCEGTAKAEDEIGYHDED
jgi:hypothetical protein